MTEDTLISDPGATRHAKRQAIGQRLKQERERLDLTQAELGAALGVSRLTVAKYEHGDSCPSSAQMEDFEALGFDVCLVYMGAHALSSEIGSHRFAMVLRKFQREAVLAGKPLNDAELVAKSWRAYTKMTDKDFR